MNDLWFYHIRINIDCLLVDTATANQELFVGQCEINNRWGANCRSEVKPVEIGDAGK